MNASKKQLIIVTGLAGSGKTVAVHALEDLGYHCIDNLPAALLGAFVDRLASGDIRAEHLALALDSRDPDLPAELPRHLTQLSLTCDIQILFLEAQEQVVIKRFRETRRLHPLSRDASQTDRALSLVEAIRHDVQLLKPIRAIATRILDTSEMSSHYLKNIVRNYFSPSDIHTDLLVNIITFGFKYEIPHDIDTMFDVRCFPNPHYVDELRPLTGLNRVVHDYVFLDGKASQFVDQVAKLLLSLYPLYKAEGKNYFGVGIGCTGGRHRSVAIAEELARFLRPHMPQLKLEHRHFDRE